MPKSQRTFCASYLVLQKDEEVLLMKRKNTGFADGKYSLVAGHVDEGETFTEAIVREAEEEIGVEIAEEDLESTQVIHRNSDGRVYVDVFFEADSWSGEIENREPEKCSELSWFNVNDLPENALGYVVDVVKNRETEELYKEHGW